MRDIFNKLKHLKSFKKNNKDREYFFASYLRHDTLFKKIVEYAYDPTKRYGLKVVPYSASKEKLTLSQKKILITKIFKMLDVISEKYRKKVPKDIIIKLSSMVSKLEYGPDVFTRIVRKDLDVLVNKKTIIKIFPSLIKNIPKERYLSQIYIEKIKYPAFILDLYNGYGRINVIVSKKQITYVTTGCRICEIQNKKIDDEFFKLAGNQEVVFICRGIIKPNEFTYSKIGKHSLKKNKRIYTPNIGYVEKINNMAFYRMTNNNSLKEEHEYLKFYIEEIIPINDFKNGLYSVPLKKRINLKEYKKLDSCYYIDRCEYKVVYSQKEALEYSINKIKKNLSCVLKQPNSYWKSQINRQCVTISQLNLCDLKIKKVEYNVGRVSCLYCESKDKIVKIKLTKCLDKIWFKKKTQLINKTARLIFFKIIDYENKKIKGLYNTTFVDIVKHNPNTYDEILKKSKRGFRCKNEFKFSPKIRKLKWPGKTK